MRLSHYAVGRDNNFTLLRFSAAMTVLFAHSIGALGLPPETEPVFRRVGFSLGEMGLDALFVTSGFLVTASLVNRGDLISFFWARALRVYPALWVMLLLTVFVLAPALTTLPLHDYFASDMTWSYFAKCGTLLGGIRYSLPGVFDTLPLKGEFNGSLWTMPVEVRMYIYVAVLWVAFALLPALRSKGMRFVSVVAVALFFVIVLRGRFSEGAFNGANIRMFMYLYGSALYLWRDRVPMGVGTLLALLAALVVASFDRTTFLIVYLLAMAPFVLHLAYVPGGRIRRFNDWGDYSYGVYIYAFPVQQTLAFLFPALTLAAMMASSAAVSLAIAIVSWKLIEERALEHKDDFAAKTWRLFNLGLARMGVTAGPDPST
ncbi:acyltransferase family protein [Roseiarcus sp.]|uniref:acyltransferase family protein n=1 Tax=Roseiarcus sp. TaxID=1969460 RepID=UPI003F956314